MAGVTRRTVLTAGAALAGVGVEAGLAVAGMAAVTDRVATPHPSGAGIAVKMNVNGTPRELTVDARVTVLDLVREQLHLTGTKKGCDQGQCGACTVLVNGERVLSCLTLAVTVQGKRVDTIEGLAQSNGKLHPMQQAFIDQDAFQCGYCTPGQIMSAIACVHEGHASSDADIQEYMSGNLCRCAAYPKIVAAINQARGKMGHA